MNPNDGSPAGWGHPAVCMGTSEEEDYLWQVNVVVSEMPFRFLTPELLRLSTLPETRKSTTPSLDLASCSGESRIFGENSADRRSAFASLVPGGDTSRLLTPNMFCFRLRDAQTLFSSLLLFFSSFPLRRSSTSPAATTTARSVTKSILRLLTTSGRFSPRLAGHGWNLIQLLSILEQDREFVHDDYVLLADAILQFSESIHVANQLLVGEANQLDESSRLRMRLAKTSGGKFRNFRYFAVKNRILKRAGPSQLDAIQTCAEHQSLLKKLPRRSTLRAISYRIILLNYHHRLCFGSLMSVLDDVNTGLLWAMLPDFAFSLCVSYFGKRSALDTALNACNVFDLSFMIH